MAHSATDRLRAVSQILPHSLLVSMMKGPFALSVWPQRALHHEEHYIDRVVSMLCYRDTSSSSRGRSCHVPPMCPSCTGPWQVAGPPLLSHFRPSRPYPPEAPCFWGFVTLTLRAERLGCDVIFFLVGLFSGGLKYDFGDGDVGHKLSLLICLFLSWSVCAVIYLPPRLSKHKRLIPSSTKGEFVIFQVCWRHTTAESGLGRDRRTKLSTGIYCKQLLSSLGALLMGWQGVLSWRGGLTPACPYFYTRSFKVFG